VQTSSIDAPIKNRLIEETKPNSFPDFL